MINEIDLSRSFDPFFTAKETATGTDQGLAIAHSVVVDKHGGSVSSETELGKGTTFAVSLPILDVQCLRDANGQKGTLSTSWQALNVVRLRIASH